MNHNPNIDLDQLEEALLADKENEELKNEEITDKTIKFDAAEFAEYTRKETEAEAVKAPEEEEEDYLKEILEEIPTLGQEGRNTYVDNSRRTAPVKKKENNLTLGLLLCAESLGILCLVLWWLARML